MVFFYRVARASEYLAITGFKIKDIKLAKKAWILPGQSCTVFDISPVNYTFEVQAMSAEKLPFILPAVFTIGPRVDAPDNDNSLLKYARLISPHDKLSHHVKELVQGVIEGETRVLAASMTMEEIFKGTKSFKEEVFEKVVFDIIAKEIVGRGKRSKYLSLLFSNIQVQLELNQFGLLIYNANVKQLVDVQGHEYFSYLGQKTQQEAANQAKVDVSEARMKGEIGSKKRDGQTLQNAAKIDAETKIYKTNREGEGKKEEMRVRAEVKVYENEREAEVAEANAELAKKKAGWEREAEVAKVESAKAVAIREAELQMEVERRNALRETEKLKAQQLSKAIVDYEMKVQEANWGLYKKQKAAEALLYEQQKIADGQKAQGTYLSTLLGALGGNYAALRDYLMINKGMYQDIAKINANAIQGLQPKISVWTSNDGEKGEGGAMKEFAGVYRMLPPLFKTVHEQTGMIPPTWMGTLPESSTD
ncbi:hypothetical protein J5N97_021916 [Dioscorea zingiberensis]|uniref:Flotillin-like n=1 Tax=Dioscorea zingiberensis TaxID=325984 RepID=A0A9D5CA11_9LILI|nr:hypothetical protein J5N97_021916 [Dioscorea zingiberensis]